MTQTQPKNNPENTKMATVNSEIVRRMLNVSEDLPMKERIEVLDRVAQKMTNSGYSLTESRKNMVGALTGYERKVAASKKAKGSGWKPLHEGAAASHGARVRKKLTGKSNWFKDKKGDEGGNGEDQNCQEYANQEISKGKKRKAETSSCSQDGKGKEQKKDENGSNMVTTGVMFVDSTPHGVLVARLQRCENRMATVIGRRAKMVEMGGSQLGQTFSNRDPWAGAGCGRDD